MIERQPTGICDKNGVEIFTGDILDAPSWWWGTRYVFLDRGTCGPCKGDSVMSYILASDIENPLNHVIHNIWNGKDVEIIGRIDKTPELLNIKRRKLAVVSEEWPNEIH